MNRKKITAILENGDKVIIAEEDLKRIGVEPTFMTRLTIAQWHEIIAMDMDLAMKGFLVSGMSGAQLIADRQFSRLCELFGIKAGLSELVSIYIKPHKADTFMLLLAHQYLFIDTMLHSHIETLLGYEISAINASLKISNFIEKVSEVSKVEKKKFKAMLKEAIQKQNQ